MAIVWAGCDPRMRMLWSGGDFTGRAKCNLTVKGHFNMQLNANACIVLIISDPCCGHCVTTATCHKVEVIAD